MRFKLQENKELEGWDILYDDESARLHDVKIATVYELQWALVIRLLLERKAKDEAELST